MTVPPSTTDLLLRLPSRSLGDLEALLNVSVVLAGKSHEKMTVRQTLFFYGVAYHCLLGQSVTISRLREIYSPLGRSIEKSINQFLAPTPRYPDALGWVEQTVDPSDRRMRYLSLTEKGADVACAMVEAMRTR